MSTKTSPGRAGAFVKTSLLLLAASFVFWERLAPGATVIVQNTNEEGTGAYAAATSEFQLFDNTDALAANDGFGVMGRMTINDAQIARFYLAGDIPSIRDAFVPFSTPFSLETTGLAGAFLESRSGDTRASINHFGGSAIWLWIYKGSSIATATEHLLAQMTAVFPTDPENGSLLFAAARFSPSGVASLPVGRLGAFSFDFGAGETLPGYSTVPIGVIPEPTAAAMMAIGCIGFFMRATVRR